MKYHERGHAKVLLFALSFTISNMFKVCVMFVTRFEICLSYH